jgi:hypothetical protein
MRIFSAKALPVEKRANAAAAMINLRIDVSSQIVIDAFVLGWEVRFQMRL